MRSISMRQPWVFTDHWRSNQAGAAYLLSFSLVSFEKIKVGENAILGFSRAEMVRNTCFHIKYSLSHLWRDVQYIEYHQYIG